MYGRYSLIVTLGYRPKLLPFDKSKFKTLFYLLLCSLNRNFELSLEVTPVRQNQI